MSPTSFFCYSSPPNRSRMDGDVAQALRTQARRKGVTVSRLASDLLRQKLVTQ